LHDESERFVLIPDHAIQRQLRPSALIATTLGKIGLILVALRPDDQASYHVPSQQQGLTSRIADEIPLKSAMPERNVASIRQRRRKRTPFHSWLSGAFQLQFLAY
jgi:hypothetical protein